MSEVKETICSKCVHLSVCKFKDELMHKIKTIDQIMENSKFSCALFCQDYIAYNSIKNPNHKIYDKGEQI